MVDPTEFSMYEVEESIWGTVLVLTDSMESAIHEWHGWVTKKVEECMAECDEFDEDDEPIEPPTEPDSIRVVYTPLIIKGGIYVSPKES